MALQHLRSSTANKRPLPAGMSDGQLAINTNATSPGLFFKDSNGNLVKSGPVHVGTTAPNASPASGGATGNSTGELWLDTSVSPNQLKTWNGSAWVSDFPDEIPYEESEIRRNAAFSVGVAGLVPFGVGPAIPPGMAFFGIGADAYNPIHLLSGSFC